MEELDPNREAREAWERLCLEVRNALAPILEPICRALSRFLKWGRT